MILYHGSNVDIDIIDLNKCRPYKDFGKGFYLTTIKEQAISMAKRVSKIFGGSPIVNIFELDEDIAADIRVKKFSAPSAEWALFVMNNRNRNYKDISNNNCNTDLKYDIVVGPVADDGLAVLIETYTRGFSDIEKIVERMQYKQLSDQYSFHTERAVALLQKVGVENV